ncbi:MAG TPA: thioredoxin fold domain-containing protein [Acidiferrobacter sp.]|nr:thioredoxin fold domain-containing protein [Acidiferrobacter sp.]
MVYPKKLVWSFALIAGAFSGTVLAHTKASSARRAERATLYRSLPQATGIIEGHGPRVLYDFFDPNCPYCHMLHQRLERLIGPYHLTVHEIPVGYLTPSSLGKAAALLQAPDPVAALQTSQAHYAWRKGSAIMPVVPTPAVRRALAVNLKLDVEAAGFPLVPILVYKKADGTIRIMNSGAPPTWALKQILASIQR